MKRKNLTVIICLLAICALISVGFSAWLITNEVSQGDVGSVSVDIVKDARVKINAEIVDDEKIIFGSKEHNGTPNGWLKYDKTTYDNGEILNLDENLTITIKITVEKYSNLVSEEALTLTFAEKENGTNYAKAVEKGYVSELPTIVLNKADINDENSTKVYAITSFEVDEYDTAIILVDVNFFWGGTFGSMNPIDFYNNQDYLDGEEYSNPEHPEYKNTGDEALATLQHLNELLDNVSYTLTIQPKTEYTE